VSRTIGHGGGNKLMVKQNSGNGASPESDVPKAKLNREGLGEAYKLFAYLLPYRATFIPGFIALFVTAGLSMVFFYIMSTLVGGSRLAPTVDADALAENINQVALIMVSVLGVQAFIAYWRIRWFAKAGERALADIRVDVYGRLIRLPMSFFSESRVGELTSRIAADLTLIRDSLIVTVPQVVRQSVMLAGGLAIIFITSVKLALFMLACVPIVVIAAALFGRRVRGLSRQTQDDLAESSVVVEETLHGISNVKAFTNEEYETRRYGDAISKFLGTTLRTANARAFFVSFIIFALFGVVTLVVWFAAGMLQRQELSQDEFARFIIFSIVVGTAIGSLPEVLSQLQKAVGATHRIREILHEPEEESEKGELTGGDGGVVSRLDGAVELKDVHFAYPSRPEVTVLKGVSMRAGVGERIAIVGPSGAGKSTIIGLLLRFYDPDGGELRYDERPAADYSLKFLRSQMAMVPQEVLLFGGSIRENIAYGKPGATDEEVEEAARRANAHPFIASFPEGYETRVGDRGMKLSGGQRQRIAIARAILADPALLVLDEATSSLDSESERLVQEALDELMKGRTSIIIAHRLSTVRDADRIYVLQEGKMVESGTHAELEQTPDGLYRMLSQLQFP
jgi:ABC-type multidrug transport system fused ATPase/permease subunit